MGFHIKEEGAPYRVKRKRADHEPEQARGCVEKTFRQAFDERAFSFSSATSSTTSTNPTADWTLKKAAFADFVNHFTRLALTPTGRRKVDALVIHLRKDTTLARGRHSPQLRRRLPHHGPRQNKAAVIAAFVSPGETDWRFSFVKLDYTFEKTELGFVTGVRCSRPHALQLPRRCERELSHRQKQFIELLKSDDADPTLEQLETAFSVEKSPGNLTIATRTVREDPRRAPGLPRRTACRGSHFTGAASPATTLPRNFSARLSFSISCKRKAGSASSAAAVGSGNKDSSGISSRKGRTLPISSRENQNAIPTSLTTFSNPSFTTPRPPATGGRPLLSELRLPHPFLNGGLFEPLYGYKWDETEILLPDTLFSNDEESRKGIKARHSRRVRPLQLHRQRSRAVGKGSAVDPEMLGKVFENLLPKTSAQQRHLLHAARHRPLHVPAGAAALPRHARVRPSARRLALFLRLAERFADFEAKETKKHADKRLPESISQNASRLDDLLKTITVCDPAIGSGAFPSA